MEWLYIISAIASSLAAVLAWMAKLWWSKEFAAAKDEVIRAKEAQIELLKNEIDNLRELNPIKIREYFLSVREQLEEYNDSLRAELDEAKKEIESKEIQLTALHSDGSKKQAEINRLVNEREGLIKSTNSIESLLSGTIWNKSNEDAFTSFFSLDFNKINEIRNSHSNLRKYLDNKIISDIEINNKYNHYFIPASSIT